MDKTPPIRHNFRSSLLRHWRMIGIAMIISIMAGMSLTAPRVHMTVKPEQIVRHQDDYYAIPFNPKLPDGWEWRRVDLTRGMIARVKFTENGKDFGVPNHYFWHSQPREDGVRYWGYVSRINLLDKSVMPTKKMVYFQTAPGDDPRRNGKIYEIDATANLNLDFSLVSMMVLFLLAYPIIYKILIKKMPPGFGTNQPKANFTFIYAILAVLITNLVLFDDFRTPLYYEGDSRVYLNFTEYGRLLNYAFYRILQIFGSLENLVIPAQFLLIYGSFILFSYAAGRFFRQMGLAVAIFLAFGVDIISHELSWWSYRHYYLTVSSESVFMGCISLALAALFWHLSATHDGKRWWIAASVMGIAIGGAGLSRPIGLVFALVIPVLIAWYLYRRLAWWKIAQFGLAAILPIVLALSIQASVYRVQFGNWAGGGEGSGFWLLVQVNSFLTKDQAQSLPFPANDLGEDARHLVQNLTQAPLPIKDEYLAATWPYQKAKLWTEAAYFDRFLNQYIHAYDIVRARHPEWAGSYLSQFVEAEKLSRFAALVAIRTYPFDYAKQILGEFIAAKIDIADGLVKGVNFFPMVWLFTLLFTGLAIRRPNRRDYLGLALLGLVTMAYVGGVCLIIAPYERYMRVAQIPATILLIAGGWVLGQDWQIIAWVRQKLRDLSPGLARLTQRGR
ncbi:MAG: hypothetical protein QM537_09510 [Candidatus Symbiobacter sp.]|nr:hypothetical protein [Candidatus Symbiobacter sp.]